MTTRDRYYANIAARAADAIKAKRASDKKAQELEARISELEALVSELNTKLEDIKAKNTSEELKKKNETIRKLKTFLMIMSILTPQMPFLRKRVFLK